MTESLEKLADNVTLRLIARISMIATAPVLGMLGWFFAAYLSNQFSMQAEATTRVQAQVEEVSSQIEPIKDRILVIETSNARGRAARDEFQAAAILRFDRIELSLNALSNAVAALAATIEADRRNAGR
jgi:hypothetical protein